MRVSNLGLNKPAKQPFLAKNITRPLDKNVRHLAFFELYWKVVDVLSGSLILRLSHHLVSHCSMKQRETAFIVSIPLGIWIQCLFRRSLDVFLYMAWVMLLVYKFDDFLK